MATAVAAAGDGPRVRAVPLLMVRRMDKLAIVSWCWCVGGVGGVGKKAWRGRWRRELSRWKRRVACSCSCSCSCSCLFLSCVAWAQVRPPCPHSTHPDQSGRPPNHFIAHHAGRIPEFALIEGLINAARILYIRKWKRSQLGAGNLGGKPGASWELGAGSSASRIRYTLVFLIRKDRLRGTATVS